MRYAKSHCLYTVDGSNYTFTGPCRVCKNMISILVPEAALIKYDKGELIQNAMPNLSADEREFLIGGACGRCFDLMFDEYDDRYHSSVL